MDGPPRSFFSPQTDSTMLDPLDMRYPGSKGLAGLYQWICERLPPHVYYAEPFAGKAAIFRHKSPALRTWLIDQDQSIVAWWAQQSGSGIVGADAADVGRRHVSVHHGCGIRWVELAAEWAPADLLIYLDPPYLPETRVKKNLYRHEMTKANHARLLRAVRRLRCQVMISGYWSKMYAATLADWQLETREVITRGGTMRTECLWSNQSARASSAVAMEYSALGADYRERQRVARKVARWSNDFAKLPQHEQRALLLRLLDVARGRRRPRR